MHSSVEEDLNAQESNVSGNSNKDIDYIAEGDYNYFVGDDSDDNNSIAHVFHENDYERRIFEELKDDKAIVKKAAQNDRYKLVERPKFLMSFESREWEGRYAAKQFRRHFR